MRHKPLRIWKMEIVILIFGLCIHCVDVEAHVNPRGEMVALAHSTAHLLNHRDQIRDVLKANQKHSHSFGGVYREPDEDVLIRREMYSLNKAISQNFDIALGKQPSTSSPSVVYGTFSESAMTMSYLIVGLWALGGMGNLESLLGLTRQALEQHSGLAQATIGGLFAVPLFSMANFFYIVSKRKTLSSTVYDRAPQQLLNAWAYLNYGSSEDPRGVFLKALSKEYEPLAQLGATSSEQVCRFLLEESF